MFIYTVRCSAILRGQLSPKSSQKTHHSSPVSASYVVSYDGPTSDLYSASIPAVVYAISCHTRSRYGGTGLYLTISLELSIWTIKFIKAVKIRGSLCPSYICIINRLIWNQYFRVLYFSVQNIHINKSSIIYINIIYKYIYSLAVQFEKIRKSEMRTPSVIYAPVSLKYHFR